MRTRLSISRLTIRNLGAAKTVQRMVTVVQSINGHKTLVEATQEFERLLEHMRTQGPLAAARAEDGRANANDICMFLETRRDDAYEQYGRGRQAQPASAALNDLGKPQKRSRTGVHAAPAVRKNLKHLCTEWFVSPMRASIAYWGAIGEAIGGLLEAIGALQS